MPINIIIRKELPIYLATVPGPVVYIFFETIFLAYLRHCLLGRIIITEQSYPNDVLPKSFLAHLLHTARSRRTFPGAVKRPLNCVSISFLFKLVIWFIGSVGQTCIGTIGVWCKTSCDWLGIGKLKFPHIPFVKVVSCEYTSLCIYALVLDNIGGWGT